MRKYHRPNTYIIYSFYIILQYIMINNNQINSARLDYFHTKSQKIDVWLFIRVYGKTVQMLSDFLFFFFG